MSAVQIIGAEKSKLDIAAIRKWLNDNAVWYGDEGHDTVVIATRDGVPVAIQCERGNIYVTIGLYRNGYDADGIRYHYEDVMTTKDYVEALDAAMSAADIPRPIV